MGTTVTRMTAEEADALYVAARIHRFHMGANHPNHEILDSAISKLGRANVLHINMENEDADSTKDGSSAA